MRGEEYRRVLLRAVIAASAVLATVCLFLAFLMESIPFEVFLPVSSITLLAACTAAVLALSSTMLGLALRWLGREG